MRILAAVDQKIALRKVTPTPSYLMTQFLPSRDRSWNESYIKYNQGKIVQLKQLENYEPVGGAIKAKCPSHIIQITSTAITSNFKWNKIVYPKCYTSRILEAFVAALINYIQSRRRPSQKPTFPITRFYYLIIHSRNSITCMLRYNAITFNFNQFEVEPSTPSYNITTCCLAASLLPQCMPLCSYNIKMSDLQTLGQVCSPQMGK